MRHTIQHDLTPEQLRLAVRKFADTYRERFANYDTQVEWQSEDLVQVSFKVKGIKLAGTLELLPREVAIEMDVPFAFRLFRSRAVQAIEEEVTPWLNKAKAGEIT